MCFSVVETKKKPMFKLFKNFYKNNKITIIENKLIACSKTTQQKLTRRKIRCHTKI